MGEILGRVWIKQKNDYYIRQFENPYRSTVAFDVFLSKYIDLKDKSILNLGCGGGENEYYFAKKYPSCTWTGLDINDDCFSYFFKYGKGLDNVKLIKGNMFDLNVELKDLYDGIISLQTLSWLSEWKKPMEEIIKLSPEFIALSSLFYEGDIENIVKSYNYERADENGKPEEAFYNVYSIPRMKRFLLENGYHIFEFEQFVIDIDLPKPDKYDWATYTIKDENGNRYQISASILMPWYFIYAKKN